MPKRPPKGTLMASSSCWNLASSLIDRYRILDWDLLVELLDLGLVVLVDLVHHAPLLEQLGGRGVKLAELGLLGRGGSRFLSSEHIHFKL